MPWTLDPEQEEARLLRARSAALLPQSPEWLRSPAGQAWQAEQMRQQAAAASMEQAATARALPLPRAQIPPRDVGGGPFGSFGAMYGEPPIPPERPNVGMIETGIGTPEQRKAFVDAATLRDYAAFTPEEEERERARTGQTAGEFQRAQIGIADERAAKDYAASEQAFEPLLNQYLERVTGGIKKAREAGVSRIGREGEISFAPPGSDLRTQADLIRAQAYARGQAFREGTFGLVTPKQIYGELSDSVQGVFRALANPTLEYINPDLAKELRESASGMQSRLDKLSKEVEVEPRGPGGVGAPGGAGDPSAFLDSLEANKPPGMSDRDWEDYLVGLAEQLGL